MVTSFGLSEESLPFDASVHKTAYRNGYISTLVAERAPRLGCGHPWLAGEGGPQRLLAGAQDHRGWNRVE